MMYSMGRMHQRGSTRPAIKGGQGANTPLSQAAILFPEVFLIVIYFIIFSICLPPFKRSLAPLKIFLPHPSMFSSCGAGINKSWIMQTI